MSPCCKARFVAATRLQVSSYLWFFSVFHFITVVRRTEISHVVLFDSFTSAFCFLKNGLLLSENETQRAQTTHKELSEHSAVRQNDTDGGSSPPLSLLRRLRQL